MTSSTEKLRITIHMLSNIIRSKGNQTMKFGQLIEHDMRNIYFENHTEKVGIRTRPS